MKWLSSIVLVLLLVGCGAENSENEHVNNEKVDNIVAQEMSKAPFTLRLISEKAQYRVGEPLAIQAELLYEGEDEAIHIGHGGSWIWLGTTNLTKDYQFGAAMNEPYIISTLKKGEALVAPYRFSGGTYYEGMSGNAYSEDLFEQMASMEFPPGQYRIDGRTDFVIEGKQGEKYVLEAHIIFEVVE